MTETLQQPTGSQPRQPSLFAAPAGDELERMAVISPCGRYRYALLRAWADGPRRVMFVGLNPSTADGMTDDPTLRRCIRFARDWGYDGLWMANLYALRSPYPKALQAPGDPVGPETDRWLARMRAQSALVVACWGADPAAPGRTGAVLELLGEPVHALGRTKAGAPRHPLYMRADAQPVAYPAAAA